MIGDEWIYRERHYGPSERVKILGIEKRKQTTRVDIQFLDGDKAGLCDNVPGIRLPGPWSDVVHYDELMANWQRLDQSSLDEAEEWAVEEVFLLLIPGDVATYCGSRVKDGTTVRDREALEQLMRCSLNALLEQVEWFEHDDVIELSADGTLIVAEYACRANPVPVLDKVMASEVEAREHCKRGKTYKSHDGEERTTTPEREYEWYRQRLRPYHELLRQWCGGHRSITVYERLTAAEAEVRRLNILLARAVDTLAEHNKIHADIYEREHNEERITPENVRPIVDRPLAPWELPVREIPVRRGRSW